MSDRYYMVSVTGWTATGEASRGQPNPSTSYSVLDSCQSHREIFTAYATNGGKGSLPSQRLAACERERDRLNALDRIGPQ